MTAQLLSQRIGSTLVLTLSNPDARNALNAELPVKRVRVSIRKPGVAWAEWAGVICERP